MQIVERTKRRSGWRVYRTLAALGLPRSVYYAWKKRENLEDRAGKPCRVYQVLPEERSAICEFALQYPKIGYRRHLKDRGLKGVQLIISDACRGLVEAAPEFFPEARWQRCVVVHWYRNVFSHSPKGKVAEVARMLKAIHAQENRTSASRKIAEVVTKLKTMKLSRAADLVANHGQETLTYFAFPTNHWRQIKTNNPLERVIE